MWVTALELPGQEASFLSPLFLVVNLLLLARNAVLKHLRVQVAPGMYFPLSLSLPLLQALRALRYNAQRRGERSDSDGP